MRIFSASVAAPVVAEVHAGSGLGNSRAGVAEVDPSTHRIVRMIDTFTDPVHEQVGGGFDGRFAVWKEYHSLTDDLADFTVKRWDRTTGRVTTIGGAHPAPGGGFIGSPWVEPSVADGRAVWIEGTDSTGGAVVVAADLVSGTTRVVHRGHPSSAMLLGDAVLWSESPAPGAPTRVSGVDLATGKVTVPPALRDVQGGSSFTTDGVAMAWVGADAASVYYASGADAEARRVFQMEIGGTNPPLSVAGRVVVVPNTDANAIVDTRTGAAAATTNPGGWGVRSGTGLWVFGGPPGAPDAPKNAQTGTFARIGPDDVALSCP